MENEHQKKAWFVLLIGHAGSVALIWERQMVLPFRCYVIACGGTGLTLGV